VITVDFRLAPTFIALYVAAWSLTAFGDSGHAALLFALLAGAGLCYCLMAVFRNQPARATDLVAGAGLVPKRAGSATGSQSVTSKGAQLIAQVAVVSTALALMSGGLAWRQHSAQPLKTAIKQSGIVVLTGKVVTEPKPAPFGSAFTWDLQVANSGRLKVIGAQVPYRATVQVEGTLKPLPTNTASDKALGQLEAASVQLVRQPNILWRQTNTLRSALLSICTTLSPQAAGLVPGMAIGDISRLPPDLKAAFKKTGLSHLTAVSGGHFAIIMLSINTMLSRVRPRRGLRLITFSAVCLGFVMLVRPEGAVVRAAAVCAIAILGTALGRKAAAVPAICAGGSVLLLLDPWLARNYGFALSCASSAALMLFSAPLAAKLAPWLGERLAYWVAVPMTATAGCAPILVLLSPYLPNATVLANLAALPVVAPATLTSLVAALLAPVLPGFATVVARVAATFTAYLAGVATLFAGLPGAQTPWFRGVPGALSLAVLLILIGLAVARWRPTGWPAHWHQYAQGVKYQIPRQLKASKQRYKYGVPNRSDRWLFGGSLVVTISMLFAISLGGTAAILRSRSLDVPSDWLVAFCNVGQGDAMVMRTGQRAGIVVDVGPDDYPINDCLTELGVDRIDLLVLSHFHADHIGGLRGALAGRKLAAALVPDTCDLGTGVIQQLNAASAQVIVAEHNLAGEAGRVAWQVLGDMTSGESASCAADSELSNYESPDLNDKSLAIKLSIPGSSSEATSKAMGNSPANAIDVIALGDLELLGQEQLLNWLQGQEEQIGGSARIVKVAHHGSAKQSYELARYLKPRVAVFSVGANNTFGHPTDRALSMYEQLGALTVRTDQCGTAVFSEHGDDLALVCLAN